mmetsp:Transcript_3971/g.4856  ORF Transcript_3971/g.4856 Transcript_3971/m.4856 type:complete len:94 (+) Transcript_3971:421-702(+)|eukprot:CAMPEP_0168355482 /NCGR_PEP_ID=MMETSP0213-20121227/24582_1 /TAXON_ID=151035 /ORGANISM="Euplotes harpa, Strain FSP1.4" /LENGTH=93 /DNA_ID=CAMNT_0008367711 /DNA_START=463 /DNA_END=744 /DNA_ORIENTATION=+
MPNETDDNRVIMIGISINHNTDYSNVEDTEIIETINKRTKYREVIQEFCMGYDTLFQVSAKEFISKTKTDSEFKLHDHGMCYFCFQHEVVSSQ